MLPTNAEYLKTDTFLNSLVTDGKVNKEAFRKLLNGIAFLNEIKSNSTIEQNGVVKLATDQQVIDKIPVDDYDREETLVVSPYQLPDVNAENSSVVVNEVIWNVTDNVVAPNTNDDTKTYRKRYLAKTNPSTTAQYDNFLTTIGVSSYTFDGTSGMPNLVDRTLQLCTYGTTVMEDGGATPAVTFVSATGVLTFNFTMIDIGQVKLISTG